MAHRIPTSTSLEESAVIKAPLAQVWHHIKLQNFSDFWSALTKSEHVKGASEETDIVKWTFKDGHVLEVKQEEHSVSLSLRPCHKATAMDYKYYFLELLLTYQQSINHSITYSVITSQPALSYTSVVSTIRCFSITSGELEGATYVQWTGNFSSDADAGESYSYHTCQCHDLADTFYQVSLRTASTSAAKPSQTSPRLHPRSR